jgi:hypothetical protein
VNTRLPLTPGDLELLEFERIPWASLGRREHAIRLRFGLSLTRYTQRILAIIEHPQAQAYDPRLVATVRAQRDRRRTARVHGFEEAMTR